MRSRSPKRFILALLAGCVIVASGVWLSSGTLAPYAATLERPRLDKPCNYLLNTDHVHFEAPFLMLDGAPREQWDFSIYLRRILFPLAAYPLMKLLGFMAGGVITSAIIQVGALAVFGLYVRRHFGDVAAYAAIVLVALYPGTYYWAGLPYNHVMIAPASLLGVLLLWEIEKSQSLGRCALAALFLGVLSLGYDLMPLFAPAAVMILLFRRRIIDAGVSALLLVLPTLLTNALLSELFGLPFRNKNTQTYYDMLYGYLHPSNLAHWARLASRAPGDMVEVYFFSNFWFLPALFLVVLVINRLTIRLRFTSAEKWLLGTTLALFAFINLAPPTPGWQFRGSGLARIYQPAFAAMILFLARWFAAAWSARKVQAELAWTGRMRLAAGALATSSLLNALVIFGPVLHIPLANHVYHSFYRHATSPALSKNLETFGRRPLGLCDRSIAIENPLSNRELRLLKEKKKRDLAKKLKAAKKKRQQREAATAAAAAATAPATLPATTPAGGPSAPADASAPSPDG